MLDLIIDIDDISVSTNSILLSNNPSEVNVVTAEPLMQVHDNKFVLSSSNYSSGNGIVGAIPNWLLTAIQQELTNGDGNVMSILSSMDNTINTLKTSVVQSIAALNTTSLSQSSLLTGLRSDVNSNNISILNALATKVDAVSATAIATNAIQSTFGADAHAFVGNIVSTYINANSSMSQDMNLLTTTLNGVNENVLDIATLTTESVPNPLWVDDGSQLDPDIDGNTRYITQAKAKKQLAIDANGVVTSLLLDSGSAIAITMQADQFKIVASGQSVTGENPFTVDATSGNISFNGIVDFTNTNTLGNTTIDGSKITTGSINAAQIADGTITAGQIASSTITADRMNISSLSTISANIGTITAGSISAALVTAGTLSIARLPNLTIQNSVTTSSSTTLPPNTTQSSWPNVYFTAPSSYVTYATLSHNKTSTSNVRISYNIRLGNNGTTGTIGTGHLWIRLKRSGTVLVERNIGYVGAAVMAGSSPATSITKSANTGFIIDSTILTGTFSYTLELAVNGPVGTDDQYYPDSIDFETFQTII
jgi:hypothetical protein